MQKHFFRLLRNNFRFGRMCYLFFLAREQEVMRLIARGYTYKEVAAEL